VKGNRKILVIEDEPAVAENIGYALTTEGFAPLHCGTGAEGMEALGKEDIALIILDVGLPDVNGFELCKDIRETSDVPVIFLTARAEEMDRIVGLEIGADDYVVKPFSPRELTARVKAILRRRMGNRNDDPPAETVGAFQVDGGRRVVSYHGMPLELTRYEYRLLEVLLRRPGWVYTREVLMQQAWDDPDASMDRTVDAHIKSLRAKLRAVMPDEVPIVTHRGVGYSLRDPA
jgi:two-component system catabolic regulation response regulator CreB